MNSLSLIKVQYTIIIARFFSINPTRTENVKKKKKGTIKECIFEFPCTDDFFQLYYLSTMGIFFKLAENYIRRSNICRTFNEEYAIYRYLIKKMYNLINNHFVCIFPGQYYTFIHDCIYNGEGNMNPEGNMIVLEVIIFISPEHSCNKLFLYRNSSNANMY